MAEHPSAGNYYDAACLYARMGRLEEAVAALEPAFEKTKAMLGDRARSDEDVLSYIAFPQVAEKFFDAREEKENRHVKYTVRQID